MAKLPAGTKRTAKPPAADGEPIADAEVSLLPYQAIAVDLADTPGTDVLVIEKSRRIGLTWALASYAVLKASRAKSVRGSDVMYISYSQEMTREFVDACAMWAREFSRATIEKREFLFDDTDPSRPDETRQIKAFRIKFKSNFEIIALSSAPRSLRGKQGVVIIDEAAFVDALSELLKSALAFLMWGGQVIVVSTHNGVANPFNQLVQDVLSGKRPYRHLRIDLDDALRDGLYRRICLVGGKPWDQEAEDKWRADLVKSYGDGADEELFCVPNASSGAWLSSVLIEARSADGVPVIRSELPADFLFLTEAGRSRLVAVVHAQVREILKQLDPARRHAAGFDFARYSDLSVLWINEIEATTRRRCAFVIELRRWPYKEQRQLLVMVFRALPRFISVCMDGTGAGLGLAEDTQRDMKMSGVNIEMLSVPWYRDAMPPVRRAFEDGTISIPKDDDIHDDFRAIVIKEGVPQVPALRKGASNVKRHADSAVACVLAFKASSLHRPGIIDFYRHQVTGKNED